jgi:hypothetical protein
VANEIACTYLAGVEKVVEDWFSHFHEDNFVGDAGGETGLFGVRAGLDNEEGLSLDVCLRWGLNC